MEVNTSAPRLLTGKEQAAQMNCSLRHLINLRKKKLIPYIKLGGKSIRYDPVAVHRALTAKLTVNAR